MIEDLKSQTAGGPSEDSSNQGEEFADDSESVVLNSPHGEPAKKKKPIKIIGIDEENSVDYLLKQKRKNKKNTEYYKKEIDRLENQALIDQINYYVVAKGFHKGSIDCMDICVQRPIICTLSKEDSSIRIWNYDSGECELEISYADRQK